MCLVAQLCLIVCNAMDCSLPCSVCGNFQTRILEWVAISYSRGPSQPRGWTHASCVSCIGRQIPYHRTTAGTPVTWMLVCLRLFQRALKRGSPGCFPLFCVCADPFLCIVYLLLLPSSVFFYCSYCNLQLCLVYFMFPNSLFKFSHCVHPFFYWLWWAPLITTIINQADRFLISTLFSSFSDAFVLSFIWNVFLCLLILSNPLCLFLCVYF